MPKQCARCTQRGKTWEGGDPECAFPDGDTFSSENWNCATMNELRDLAEDSAAWSNDQNAAIIPLDGDFIVLGWYKRRGRTEFAGILSELRMTTLTLRKAEEAIASIRHR